jgi:hypothetical protein
MQHFKNNNVEYEYLTKSKSRHLAPFNRRRRTTEVGCLAVDSDDGARQSLWGLPMGRKGRRRGSQSMVGGS